MRRYCLARPGSYSQAGGAARIFVAPITVALAVGLYGCGGGGTAGAPGQMIRLSAVPGGGLTFNPAHATAGRGKVELIMTNPSQVGHGIAIDGAGVSSIGAIVGRGGTSTVTVRLKPGEYTFYCPVPAHRQAGMHGTLTVR